MPSKDFRKLCEKDGPGGTTQAHHQYTVVHHFYPNFLHQIYNHCTLLQQIKEDADNKIELRLSQVSIFRIILYVSHTEQGG